jgi:hypothetical protein
MFLQKEIAELEQMINHSDQLNPKVSAKAVGWHIDHSLKAINGICGLLKKSDPKEYQWKFNLSRSLVYTFNYIPRGVGRAPKTVVATLEISKEELIEQLEKAKVHTGEVENLSAKSHFKHPYFNLLDLRRSKKFMRLHTRHHLKIMYDIVKA